MVETAPARRWRWWPAGCGASDVSGGRWRCRGNAIGAETASTMAEAVNVMVVATAAALVVRRIGQSGPVEADGTHQASTSGHHQSELATGRRSSLTSPPTSKLAARNPTSHEPPLRNYFLPLPMGPTFATFLHQMGGRDGVCPSLASRGLCLCQPYECKALPESNWCPQKSLLIAWAEQGG